MNFQQELEKIVTQVKGCKAAVLMGVDGIAVAEAKSTESGFSFQEAATEYSRLLTEGMKIAQSGDHGAMQELCVGADRYRFIFRVLNHEYFLGILLTPEGYLGQGRFQLQKAAPIFLNEL